MEIKDTRWVLAHSRHESWHSDAQGFGGSKFVQNSVFHWCWYCVNCWFYNSPLACIAQSRPIPYQHNFWNSARGFYPDVISCCDLGLFIR
jgi:hypothetical protein